MQQTKKVGSYICVPALCPHICSWLEVPGIPLQGRSPNKLDQLLSSLGSRGSTLASIRMSKLVTLFFSDSIFSSLHSWSHSFSYYWKHQTSHTLSHTVTTVRYSICITALLELQESYLWQYHSPWHREHLFVASFPQDPHFGFSGSKLSITSKLYVWANLVTVH